MFARRAALAAFALTALFGAVPAQAQEKVKLVATFSILADLVKNVGGDRVEIASLVPPNGDTHVYAASPADTKRLADAKVVFTNGLGFEGWIPRLVKASGTDAAVVVATKGIKMLKMEEEGRTQTDPHAWQSVANAKLYVANIRNALVAADPAGKAAYESNATAYLAKLDALETDVRGQVARIPADHIVRCIRASPDIALAMIASTSQHLHHLVQQVEQLKAQSGVQRVAEFLASLSSAEQGTCAIALPYDKVLIAARLGLTPESLSRAFAKLRAVGVVVNASHVVVRDVGKLRQLAADERGAVRGTLRPIVNARSG